MIRWIIGITTMALVVVGVAAWAMSKPTEVPTERSRPRGPGGAAADDAEGRKTVPASWVASTARPQTYSQPLSTSAINDPLVITDLRATLRFAQEVPCTRAGTLRLLATEIKPGEPAPPADRLIRFAVPVLLTTLGEGERTDNAIRIPGDDRLWRLWQHGESIEPGRIRIDLQERIFRRLREGDVVKGGDMIGLIDTDLAAAEMLIKIANIRASEAKREATVKTRDEAQKRWEALEAANRKVPGSVTLEDRRAAELTIHRYAAEMVSEEQNVHKAAAEIRQAHLVIRQHILRVDPDIRVGVVKTIYRKVGEAVKEHEPVVLVQNQLDLQVEGMVEVQKARRLQEGQEVFVEATVQKAPMREISGHLQEVLAVAVSKGTQPWVVSASADRNVRLCRLKEENGSWLMDRTAKVWWLEHPSAVRALACSPRKAADNLLLTGAADGTARLWNLADVEQGKEPSVRELKGRHGSAINAVAFSSDGAWCATGGDDRSVLIFRTQSGEQVHALPNAHKGAITSLSFAPEGRLVSAGRDNTIHVWKLEEGKAPSAERTMDRRLGTVDQVGVSADGKHVLYDQGKELRVLALADGRPQGVIENSSGAVNFTTFALFSPDGNTVVTAGASDNRLQLWRNPALGRASELRQYVWTSAQTTCAAFDEQSRILVTGTQDRAVLIWALPSAEEIKGAGEANAVVSLVEDSLDTGSRQVKVRAIVKRKPEGLIPGATATLVMEPKSK